MFSLIGILCLGFFALHWNMAVRPVLLHASSRIRRIVNVSRGVSKVRDLSSHFCNRGGITK